MSRRVRALFVTYGGGHVGMILPVIQAVERRVPGIDVQLMALTTGYLRASAVRPTLGYQDFLHLVDDVAARDWGRKLLAGNASPDVPTEESIAYLGANYLDLIAQHGEEGAAELYRSSGRLGFQPRRFMRRVLEELRPDVVVATNSPRTEQAALESAAVLGIPSVGMVDLFGLDADQYVLRDNRPDFTCVISENVRSRLLTRGFSPDGVVVTGNPAFDGLFGADAVELSRDFLARKGWAGLTPILFAGHSELAKDGSRLLRSQERPRQIETMLRQHVSVRNDLALIVRYHPSDWRTFPRVPDVRRTHFSETPREGIHPLILASGAVVVQGSTVGLEAAVAGKPVVSVESSPGAYTGLNLAQLGVSTSCPTPEALPEVLDRVLAGGGDAVREEYRSDGQASSRVASVIETAARELR